MYLLSHFGKKWKVPWNEDFFYRRVKGVIK